MTEGSDRERRDGRGRLSSLDLLPEEAQDDIVWAIGELNERRRSQADILFELNDRLEVKGVPAISKSAFNRRSMKVAAMSARLNEARAIFEGVAPQLTPDRIDDNTAALGEFIRLLIFEMVQADGTTIGPKGAMELANAHLAVIRASSVSSDRRLKLEAEFKARAAQEVGKVADKLGLSPELRQNLNAELFGQAPPKPRAALP